MRRLSQSSKTSHAQITSKLDPLKIALIPADGIGKEVVSATHAFLHDLELNAILPPIEWTYLDAGWETFQKTGKVFLFFFFSHKNFYSFLLDLHLGFASRNSFLTKNLSWCLIWFR